MRKLLILVLLLVLTLQVYSGPQLVVNTWKFIDAANAAWNVLSTYVLPALFLDFLVTTHSTERVQQWMP